MKRIFKIHESKRLLQLSTRCRLKKLRKESKVDPGSLIVRSHHKIGMKRSWRPSDVEIAHQESPMIKNSSCHEMIDHHVTIGKWPRMEMQLSMHQRIPCFPISTYTPL